MAYKIFSANDVKAAVIDVSADSFAIIDANDSNKTRKESVADLITAVAGSGLSASSGVLAVDLGEVDLAAVDNSADFFLFLDGGASGATKKDSIADLMTAAAGTGLSAASGALSVDASQPQITTLAGLTAAGSASANLTLTYSSAKLQSSSASEPTLIIENTNADANAGTLKFNKDGASAADNDMAGMLMFSSEDSASNAQNYASMSAGMLDVSDGAEKGFMEFRVAEFDGTLSKALEIKGLGADNGISVDVPNHGSGGGGLMLAGTLVSSTAAELNILDGVTSTTAELNILDGVTSTAAELNLVDGSSGGTVVNGKAAIYGSSGELNATTLQIGGSSITASVAELNIMDGVTATTAELNIMDGVTATTAELNIMDGVTATTAELNILDGVTATAAELNILDGVTSTTAELNILDGVTSTAAELNILDGVTATAAELNYSDTGAAVGTVVASKVVTVDANKDVGTIRNLTIDGVFTDGNYTFDTSGNVSGLGTVASGAITSSGIITAGGRLICDATDDASNTANGSIQTDGGLSVVKNAVIGKMLGCQAISVSGVVSKTANFTVDSVSGTFDAVILADTSGGSALTITLPAASAGRQVVIKDAGGTAATDAITIASPGSEEIDGSTDDFVLEVNYAAVTCVSDGSNWFIV